MCKGAGVINAARQVFFDKHIILLHLREVVYLSDTDIIRISVIYPSHTPVGTYRSEYS